MKAIGVVGTLMVILAVVFLAMMWRKAPRPPEPPPVDQFRLQVLSSARTPESWTATMKVTTVRPHDDSSGGVSIRLTHSGGGGGVTASPGMDSRTCEATVGLNATLLAQPDGSKRLRTSFPINAASGSTGGTSEGPTTAQQIWAVASFTPKDGTYPKGVPLTLGTLNGQPIQLIVGQ